MLKSAPGRVGPGWIFGLKFLTIRKTGGVIFAGIFPVDKNGIHRT